MRINRLADVLCIALLTDYYNRSMLVKAVKNSSREDDLKKKKYLIYRRISLRIPVEIF